MMGGNVGDATSGLVGVLVRSVCSASLALGVSRALRYRRRRTASSWFVGPASPAPAVARMRTGPRRCGSLRPWLRVTARHCANVTATTKSATLPRMKLPCRFLPDYAWTPT